MRPLPRFLVRAPLLPLAALRKKVSEPLFERAMAEKKGARDRYLRRAAFRPTPHGLWAGVLMGQLGARTRIDTGMPEAQLFVSHARRWAEARARLNDPAERAHSKIRIAPSLIHDDRQASWLAFGEDGSASAVIHEAEVDELLIQLIERAREWIEWPSDLDDELLLQLIDDGFLVSDLEPPLVGPPPPRTDEIDHAIITFDGEVTLPRAIVERAARLAPVLHRLQQVMAPPVAERAHFPAVEVIEELFGRGALDLSALARGDYGVLLQSASEDAPAIPTWLLEQILATASGGDAHLDSAELDARLPPSELGPTCELFVQPTRTSRGWLLGLHAPAGATWGRFAHALGQPMMDALADLAEAERAARPGEEFLDLSFAPTRALADLASHPPLRKAALSLLGWCEPSIAIDSLSLVGAGLRAGDQPVRPSPLHRLRSTTAPDGVHRLLAGWSLHRQHAPWAFTWGALASLPRLPRVTLDDFVIAPASWRIPPPKTNLKKWRRELGVPRFVQVGEEDELLFVDLDEKNPLDKLRGRVWEIWPPLDEKLDRSGRRIEAVIALVSSSENAAAEIAATAAARELPPPAIEGPAEEWLSYKLFGAPDRADAVLHGVIAPFVDEARRAGELQGWFFLRYVDPPGRPHLRVRFLGDHAALEARFAEHLEPARAAGDVVIVERNDYFREYARYGREAYPTLEKLFEIDSDLALTTLGQDRLVPTLDALASQLDLRERRELARQLRNATEHELEEDLAPEYRARQKELLSLLRDRPRVDLPPFDRALLPTLLHLAVVRRDPSEEARAYYFWERALESLSRQPVSRRDS